MRTVVVPRAATPDAPVARRASLTAPRRARGRACSVRVTLRPRPPRRGGRQRSASGRRRRSVAASTALVPVLRRRTLRRSAPPRLTDARSGTLSASAARGGSSGPAALGAKRTVAWQPPPTASVVDEQPSEVSVTGPSTTDVVARRRAADARPPPPGGELTEIFASNKRHGGKRPGNFDAAYLSRRYRSEFEILEVPAPVRRLVFPVIVAVGKLFGLHRRFAGAPEPVRSRAPSS